jgi:DNA processing protein
MSDRIRHRLARLARAQNVTAAQLCALSAVDPTLELVEHADGAALARFGLATAARHWLSSPDLARVAADEAWLDTSGAALLPATSADYPRLLALLPDAPAVLYVRGQVSVLCEPQIAIVGSRNPTAGGRDTARSFAAQFARAGLGITSGLALGIDTASHQGALDAGGFTIAVLGCGLDRIYPAENRGLADRLAGAAGREVFAVPGSIHNEMARGCHELIRQGAKLVERPEDVLCELKISLLDQMAGAPEPKSSDGPVLDKAYKILLDALAFEPASIDSLIERTGLNSESIASMLLILELDGHVAPHPGGRYSRMAGH